MDERQAGGGKNSARYMKHDSARLKCMQRVVFPGLRMGELPSKTDAKMHFDMPGPREIGNGPAAKDMDQWSLVYARAPRSKDKVVAFSIEGQTDLNVYAGQNPQLAVHAPAGPPRPRVRLRHSRSRPRGRWRKAG